MKSFIAPAAALALASTSAAAVVPLGKNGAFWTNETAVAKRDNQICVQVQSTVSTWYYTFSGVWGSDSGEGPSAIGSFCVSANSAGGAMYIGPDANPGPGSTKLECFFTNDGQSNCDVSLVDGYSLAMQCHANGQSATIGGPVALYSQGNACPDQQGPNCINQNGGNAPNQDAINAFFQPAVQNGNNYCIWENCAQDYSFTASDGITCTVDPSGM